VNAPVIALTTFGCTFGCALGAAYLRTLLPPPHFTKESQDVVRLGMGLVATMTALLLGIVTASARSAFDEHDSEIKSSAVSILTLDRQLARYGPETKPTRDLIKQALAFRIEATWPTDASRGRGYGAVIPTVAIEDIENQILALTPQNDTQRWFKSESLRLTQDVLKTRWRILQATGEIPATFLFVVIFWLTMTFASFGLYAPTNATVIAVLFIAAVSVAAAMFLIVELDGPFDGLIRVSGEPLRFALSNLGQ